MFKKLFFIVFAFPYFMNGQQIYLTGSDTICDNDMPANIYFDIQGGVPPYTFVYSINNEIQIYDTIRSDISTFIKTKKAGEYKVVYFSDSDPTNGLDTIIGSANLYVNISPTAIISSYDTLSIISPSVNFISISTGNIMQQVWDYGDGSLFDTIDNPTHVFSIDDINSTNSTFNYSVQLFIEDIYGCSDTTTKNILIIQDFWMFIPNSFTPDNDKINDKFCIEYNGIRESTFLFKIYNSHGDLMYQTIDATDLICNLNNGWDGTHYNTGKKLPADLYLYELYFQDFAGWRNQKFGEIILIR